MATASGKHVRSGRFRREHVVAAGLVGTVVVVVGFASGLGLHQQASDTAQPSTAPPARTPTTRTPTTQQQPTPVQPVHQAGGGAGGAGGVPQPVQRQPNPVITTPTHSHRPPAPTSLPPTTTPTTTSSLPPCDPGLVRSLVDTVDGTAGGLTGLLGLPTKPLNPLLTPVIDPLLGTPCQPPSTTSTPPSR